MRTRKQLNIFLRAGLLLDTIGLFIALFIRLNLGFSILVVGVVHTIIGLVQCIKHKENLRLAIFYVVLGFVFLGYVLVTAIGG